MTASKWAVSEALREGVGHGGLALGDEGLQRLVDARVDRRRLVAVQHLLPHAVGALVNAAPALRLPLLEGVVVGDAGAPERRIEVGAGMGAAEEVAARAIGIAWCRERVCQ